MPLFSAAAALVTPKASGGVRWLATGNIFRGIVSTLVPMQVTAAILVRGQVLFRRAVPQSYSSPHQAAVGLRSLRVVIMHEVRYRLSTENKFKFLLS
jgi:uncharacterized membrane protein